MSDTASIAGNELLARLRASGFDFFTGVPCSLFTGLYRALEAQQEVPLIESVREDEAVAQAAGAYLAGKRPVVLMQNSGLGNSLNVIVSLSQIYEMPFLAMISWRGFMGRDAPEHIVMGKAMTDILTAIDMPFQVLDPDALDDQLSHAREDFERGVPAALIVKEGVVT
jgi:sulfopyruvate decarboxylase subunit alpha